MTVDVLAMGMVSFLVGVMYANHRIESSCGRIIHEINNIRVRLNGLERKVSPNSVDNGELR